MASHGRSIFKPTEPQLGNRSQSEKTRIPERRKTLPNAGIVGERVLNEKPIDQTIEERMNKDAEYAEILVYRQVFEDIIQQDTVYGGLLKNVKAKYDEFITNATVEFFKSSNSTDSSADEEATLDQIQKQKENIAQKIQDEKKKHAESLNKMSKDLRSSKNRENKYMELMKALKSQGCPVEELYNTYLRKNS